MAHVPDEPDDPHPGDDLMDRLQELLAFYDSALRSELLEALGRRLAAHRDASAAARTELLGRLANGLAGLLAARTEPGEADEVAGPPPPDDVYAFVLAFLERGLPPGGSAEPDRDPDADPGWAARRNRRRPTRVDPTTETPEPAAPATETRPAAPAAQATRKPSRPRGGRGDKAPRPTSPRPARPAKAAPAVVRATVAPRGPVTPARRNRRRPTLRLPSGLPGELAALVHKAHHAHVLDEPHLVDKAAALALEAAQAMATGHDPSTPRKGLETLANLPAARAVQVPGRAQFRAVLDEEVFGMDAAKDVLADVLDLNAMAVSQTGSPRLGAVLLVGEPGTGKTTLARATARAAGLEVASVSLAADNALDFAGQGTVWSDAQPGSFTRELGRVGNRHCVTLLDEIDKMPTSREHGQTSTPLLSCVEAPFVLAEGFLGVDIGVSAVWFIATANDPYEIPGPLFDRFRVVEVPSYDLDEMALIIERHTLAKVAAGLGMPGRVVITPEAAALVARHCRGATGMRAAAKHCEKLIARASGLLVNTEHIVEVDTRFTIEVLGKPDRRPAGGYL